MRHFPKWWYLAVSLVVIHQILQKACRIHIPIIDNYLDAILFLPITLELLLWEKKVFLKNNNYMLSWLQIFVITILLSIITEYIFPKFQPKFVFDYMDITLYFISAIIWKFHHNHSLNQPKQTIKF